MRKVKCSCSCITRAEQQLRTMWKWCVLFIIVCECSGFNRCILRGRCGLPSTNIKIVSRRTAASRKADLIWEVVRPKVDVAVDEDGSPSLAALTGGYPPVKVDVDSLVEEWIEKCIAEGRSANKQQFTLKSAVPLAATKGPLVELVNKTLDREQTKDKTVTYVTSMELENIWKVNTFRAMGKPMESFDEDEAMMMLDDEDERELLGAEEVAETLEDTEHETIITLQELERLWEDRAKIAWGLPAQKFDPESALMLLDRDDDTSEEEAQAMGTVKGVSALSALEEGMPEVESGLGDLSVADQLAYYRKFPGRGNAHLRETLKRIYDDLEDTEPHRPAWKRERSFLTPDIDTQEFMGDIMFSNTYLTQRIPANWNDPEAGEMSEIYNSTATMALPGQPETDYNTHRPIWEELQLPIGPDHSRGKGLVETLQERAAVAQARRHGVHLGASSGTAIGSGKQDNNFIETAPRGAAKTPSSSGTTSGGKKTGKSASSSSSQEIDWENFDFSAAEDGLNQPAADAPDDIDEFFRAFEATDDTAAGAASGPISPKAAGKSGISPAELMGRMQDASVDYDDLSSEENAERRRELFQKNAVNGISCVSLVEPKFVLPEVERARLRDSDLVGYEEWSTYGVEEGFDCDDMVQDEDVYAWQALKHLKQVTDLYLDDHSLAVRHHDAAKNASRVLSNAFLGTNYSQEAIPIYLTPDANRGIKYSDEVIEMKGKKILHPETLDPRVEYANDTFTHNEEMETINKIGTIRVQYDWQPRRDLQHVIEPHKVEKLQPVIKFINHAADLQSTKDDIIIFNYKGVMRHIIGLRSTMLGMARKCYPEIKDLRLETTLTADKFDFS